MPESRNRPKHHQHLHHQHAPSHRTAGSTKAKRSAAFVLAIIAAVLGLAVAYFTQGADFFWMTAGAVAGAVVGYIIGRSMDKSIEKR